MAERERFRTDGRAVALGVTYGLTVGACVGAVAYGLASLVIPAVRDLIGGLPVRPWAVGAVAAAVVGLGATATRVRAAGRVVARGPASDLEPGTRALAILVAELGAAGGDQQPARGLSDAGAVQRWSPDLLHGGGVRPDEAVTSDA